jgi:hypothetical protein
VAIIAILAAMLLPVLGLARTKALKGNCVNNLHQLYLGCVVYADDYGDYLPEIAACNQRDWPWYPPTPIAGQQVWGCRTPIAACENGPLGVGILAVNHYLETKLFECPGYPADKNNRDMRNFGLPLDSNWPASHNGEQWAGWSSSNYYLESGYAYRSGDWCTPTDPGPVGNRGPENARISNPQWGQKSLLADSRCTNHKTPLGVNVCWGDGAIIWWQDDRIYLYTKSGQPPSFPMTTDQHGYLMSNLFYQADLAAPH